MTPMKHPSRKFYVASRKSVENINVEHILQIASDDSQIVKPPILELGSVSSQRKRA